MNKKSLINQKNIAYILIAPVVVIFLIFMVYPVLRSLYLSFFELVSGSYEFVGLKNYAALFKDEYLYLFDCTGTGYDWWSTFDRGSNRTEIY